MQDSVSIVLNTSTLSEQFLQFLADYSSTIIVLFLHWLIVKAEAVLSELLCFHHIISVSSRCRCFWVSHCTWWLSFKAGSLAWCHRVGLLVSVNFVELWLVTIWVWLDQPPRSTQPGHPLWIGMTTEWKLVDLSRSDGLSGLRCPVSRRDFYQLFVVIWQDGRRHVCVVSMCVCVCVCVVCWWQILRAHILPLTNVAFNKSGSKWVHVFVVVCQWLSLLI